MQHTQAQRAASRWQRVVAGWRVAVAAVLALVLGLGDPALVAQGAPAQQGAFTPGAVVSLVGTSHIWIADEQGTLHWNGDTRALSSRAVDWGKRTTATLEQLRGYRRGEPWLSAGLLKDGDPIYLVKWETGDARPTLLRIQSIADVELFGINGSNYGALVLDKGPWEQQFGFPVGTLTKGELSGTGSGPAAAPAPAAPTAFMREGEVYMGDGISVRYVGTQWYQNLVRFAFYIKNEGTAPIEFGWTFDAVSGIDNKGRKYLDGPSCLGGTDRKIRLAARAQITEDWSLRLCGERPPVAPDTEYIDVAFPTLRYWLQSTPDQVREINGIRLRLTK